MSDNVTIKSTTEAAGNRIGIGIGMGMDMDTGVGVGKVLGRAAVCANNTYSDIDDNISAGISKRRDGDAPFANTSDVHSGDGRDRHSNDSGEGNDGNDDYNDRQVDKPHCPSNDARAHDSTALIRTETSPVTDAGADIDASGASIGCIDDCDLNKEMIELSARKDRDKDKDKDEGTNDAAVKHRCPIDRVMHTDIDTNLNTHTTNVAADTNNHDDDAGKVRAKSIDTNVNTNAKSTVKECVNENFLSLVDASRLNTFEDPIDRDDYYHECIYTILTSRGVMNSHRIFSEQTVTEIVLQYLEVRM